MWQHLQQWDRNLLVYLNSLGTENTDAFWIFVTKIEHWIPFYLLLFFVFFKIYDRRKAITGVLLTVLTFSITLALTEFTKNMVQRIRPNNTPELAEIIRVLQDPENFSFFSGHAAVSVGVVTFVVLAMRRRFVWAYAFYIWPLLFIASRILLGVHYPSDILVGTLVGALIAFGVWKYIGKKKLS